MNPIAIGAQVLRNLRPENAIFAAAAAGFVMAGVWIDPVTWTSADTRAVRSAFRASGVLPLDAEVIRIGSDQRHEDQLRLIEIAGEVGIANIITISLTRDVTTTISTLSMLARRAEQAGTRIVLEFAPFSAVPTLETALAVVTKAGPGIGILPDPLHLQRSGGHPAALGRIPNERLSFAQICDAGEALLGATPEQLLAEARHDRRNLGDGILPLAEYVRALPFGLPLSLEVRSLAIEAAFPDPFARASMLAQRIRHCLEHWAHEAAQ